MFIDDVISNIKIDHTVVRRLLAEVGQSNHQEARKQLIILRQLLINHFYVEEFMLYPCLIEKFIRKPPLNKRRVYDPYYLYTEDRENIKSLIQNINRYSSIGSNIVLLMSECIQEQKDHFSSVFTNMSNLIQERMEFEETVLTAQTVAKMSAHRLNIGIPVQLTISGKKPWTSITININKTGCLIQKPYPTDILIEDVGLLRLLPIKKGGVYHCKTTRITKDALAVQLLEERPETMVTHFTSIYNQPTQTCDVFGEINLTR